LVEETVDASGGALDGLEITSSDFGSVLDEAGDTPSLRDEVSAGEIEPLAGLEPTEETVDGADAGDLGLIDIDEEPEPEPPPKQAAAPAAAPPERKTVVEIPPLELGTDFETTTAETGHEVDDEPLAMDEGGPTHPSFITTEDDTSLAPGGRRSGFIDMGVDGI